MNRFDIPAGQPKAWTILARAQAAGKAASTYLFYGPVGVGAWSLAIEFTALLNCQSPLGQLDRPETRRPCGQCQSCRSIYGLNFEGLHLVVPIPTHKNLDEAIDLTNVTLERKRQEPFSMLDRSKSITIPVELAREIKRRLSIRGPAGVTRVVVFYQMEQMRFASADALLKMIEEPPSDTIIILTAVNPDALLPTIQSRAQKIRLERLPEQMVVDYLVQNYGATETDARTKARVMERSLGRAVAAVAITEGEETDQRGVGLLLFKTLVTEPASEVVGRMFDMLNFTDRGAAENLIALWQSLIRDCAYLANAADENELVNIDFTPEIRQMAPALSDPQVVQQMVETTKNTLADLPLNVHIQPALIAMALKLKADLEVGGRSSTG